jgi:hypothetical protein
VQVKSNGNGIARENGSGSEVGRKKGKKEGMKG